MADLPPTEYQDMQVALRSVISAHQAVSQGIATHAEKERLARDQRRAELEAQRKLQAGTSGSH
jgi:hypothetical protein